MNTHTCPWWLAYTFDHPLRRLVHKPRSMLGDFVRTGQTVLDLGCGMGYFSLGMAELVGPEGAVLAVDVQAEMLSTARHRAVRRGLESRIRFVPCAEDNIMVSEPVDFALAFWMVHEVGDVARFYRQVFDVLKTGCLFLVVEPRLHVSAKRFGDTVEAGVGSGFEVRPAPHISLSRSVLLRRPS